ncbi:MAG: peptidase Ste24p [Acidobacteriales bacterium]|nr:peptidase Ste24p [Terriglobales bacterium]
MKMRLLQVAGMFFLLSVCGWAQQCPNAPILSASHSLNLFTEEQEVQFGDIVAEQQMASLKVIETEEISGPLQKIADRLLQQMPPTKLQFKVFVLDAPYNNAFTLPGGRIFITKKMIAFVKSEDELAGVLGHEMGHQVTHQLALDWSRMFHEMMGVEKLGDRADIEDKYQQFLEMYRKKEGLLKTGDQAEHEQLGADQVAVYSLARAGYSPAAVVAFWDRFAETKGKKGSWFSDMFGTTLAESKRLREFTKSLGALPASCVATASHPSGEDFAKWQASVKNYSGFGKKEDLHNLVKRTSLEPALRGDIRHFKFSPEGQYLLAQDDSSIFVMSTKPLANLFRIDAGDAHPAQFSPDSHFVTFYDQGLRVERWNIADARMEDANEVHVLQGCAQSALSPDGAILACLIPNRQTFFPMDMSLIDVATGEPAFFKKSFVGPASFGMHSFLDYLILQSGRPIIVMGFSPDSKYFVAGRTESHLMVDLRTRSDVSMTGDLKKFTAHNFAFVGPDRIVGTNDGEGQHGALVQFPSGKILISDIPIGPLSLYPAAKGSFAILRPIAKAPIGIMDLEAKRIFLGSRTDAMDIYENQYVSERVNGEVGIYETKGQKPIATLALPRSPLRRAYAAAVSPDFKHFAVSDRTRGAVWDLTSGERIFHIRGFRGAHFGTGSLLVDFIAPDQFAALQAQDESEKDMRKREANKPGHSVAKVEFEGRKISEVASFQHRNRLQQAGSVELVFTPEDDDEPGKHMTVEAKDMQSGSVLWSRKFPKTLPRINASDAEDVAVFGWDFGTSGVKEELSGDPDLKKTVEAIKDSEGSYLIEVVDARTGKAIGKFPVDTGHGSFRVQSAYARAGLVVVADNQGRVLLYSYKGERKGRLFGRLPAISKDGSLLTVEPEPGRLNLYDVALVKKREQYTFGSRVLYYDFSEDSQKLVVLTEDQTLFVLNVSATAASKAAQTTSELKQGAVSASTLLQ